MRKKEEQELINYTEKNVEGAVEDNLS